MVMMDLALKLELPVVMVVGVLEVIYLVGLVEPAVLVFRLAAMDRRVVHRVVEVEVEVVVCH